MSQAQSFDSGEFTKRVIGNTVANASAGTLTGSAVDRRGYYSAVLRGVCGAASGTPTAQSVDVHIEDSADGSTGWADVTGWLLTQMAADNGEEELEINLNQAKRYLRVVTVVAFTGGTTPAIPVYTELVLGGPDTIPAV